MSEGTPRRAKSAVHGVLLLNKPSGMTSNRALQIAKRLFNAKKAGHTGSLDPAATGMLPLCFGEATKICAYLLDADKTYRVVAKLGSATDTGDAEGSVTESAAVPDLTEAEWRTLLQGFLGASEQVPPMYSALKQGGKRLYELARRGEVVDRDARPITIHEIALLEIRGRRLVFRVRCSKGTYVRTLVEDIARRAGTVAHTAHLHRESVRPFDAAAMVDLAVLERLAEADRAALQAALLPVDAGLQAWPQVLLSAEETDAFMMGQRVAKASGILGLVRVYGAQSRFLGIGDIGEDGRVAPRRVFRLDPSP